MRHCESFWWLAKAIIAQSMPLHQPLSLRDLACTELASEILCISIDIENKRWSSEDNDGASRASEDVKKLCSMMNSLPHAMLAETFRLAFSNLVQNLQDYPNLAGAASVLLKLSPLASMTSLCFPAFPSTPDLSNALLPPLLSAIPTMDYIQQLILKHYATNDVLNLLCKHCPLLAHLQVDYSPIDDRGLQLFGVMDDNRGIHGCPRIQTFSAQYCFEVSGEEKARLLGGWKHLCSFRVENCLSAFRLLTTSQQSASPSCVEGGIGYCALALQEFVDQRAYCFNPEESLVGFLAKSCSNVKKVTVSITDETQLMLVTRSFNHFDELTLSREKRSASRRVLLDAIFQESLQNFGDCLTRLELFDIVVSVEAIAAIGEVCWKLKVLRFIRSFVADEGNRKGLPSAVFINGHHRTFRNLEELLYGNSSSFAEHGEAPGPTESLFHALTKNAEHLRSLTILGGPEFLVDPKFWTNFLDNVNCFPDLRTLQLSCVPKVVQDIFLKSCPRLRSIIGDL